MFITLKVTLILSGCWDVTEPQKMYYFQGVGVDYKDNHFEAHIQLVNNPQISPTEISTANRLWSSFKRQF
ncbi:MULTISPECIES: hypothetical protein [Lysinibacillus]|uniref:hypothetical protein n=1 Tax=Lysinibacillus TaxID=400634 RepID=UPI001A9DBFF3|nr:hypothetical protein [Lysinibacillus sphaericus]QTB28923.1 hypothetical protein J2D51_10175 [Lysinibacillus sphaericus]